MHPPKTPRKQGQSEYMPIERRQILLYVCLLNLVACIIFFLGFFPIKPYRLDVASISDLPVTIYEVELNVSELYKKRYSRVVVMIVDALRYDFVASGNQMPFLQKKLRNKETSCLLSATTGVPTVTLPRIKAITSGTVPGFLDVIFNFGSTELRDDNLIQQAVANNLKVVFYGDDTWLNLFPSAFTRSEGTPSFFVNDFYDVDRNVTRNVMKELYKDDWDIMVLHYLGLDHIGHVEGPYGKSVSPKLQEMDSVIELIMDSFSRKDEKILLVLTGDHGMKDSGGHGGSSNAETTVPLVLLNAKCDGSFGLGDTIYLVGGGDNNENSPWRTYLASVRFLNEARNDRPFHQVDLAPLLSILMGIPIPASSTGRVAPNWIASLSLNESLYASYYNTLRMMRTLVQKEDRELEGEIRLATNHLFSFFESNWSMGKKAVAEQAFGHLFEIQNKIFSTYTTTNNVHLGVLILAVGLMVQSTAILFVDLEACSYRIGRVGKACLCTMFTSLLVLSTLGRHMFPEIQDTHFFVYPTIGTAFVFNLLLLASSRYSLKILQNADKLFLVLIGLLPLTYLSTSFIEEEHMYWYFTFATFVAWSALRDLDSLKPLFVILIMQRVLKSLNATGNKWAGDVDIGDWLKGNEHLPLMTGMLVTGTLLSMYMNWLIGLNILGSTDLLLLLLQGLCSTGHHLTRIGSPVTWANVSKVTYFWLFTAGRLIHAAIKIFWSSDWITHSIVVVITQLHVAVLTLFMDAHNVVLVPCLMLFSRIIREAVGNPWQLIVLHYWFGEVFFFYMGNSNSLATINVNVGFIGLEEFNLSLAVIYVFLNTYAFPILSHLLLMVHLLDLKRKNNAGSAHFHDMMSSMYLLLNGMPLAIFMIVIVFQREHLFIWSVFCPKLLYLMVHTILIIILTLFSLFC